MVWKISNLFFGSIEIVRSDASFLGYYFLSSIFPNYKNAVLDPSPAPLQLTLSSAGFKSSTLPLSQEAQLINRGEISRPDKETHRQRFTNVAVCNPTTNDPYYVQSKNINSICNVVNFDNYGNKSIGAKEILFNRKIRFCRVSSVVLIMIFCILGQYFEPQLNSLQNLLTKRWSHGRVSPLDTARIFARIFSTF